MTFSDSLKKHSFITILVIIFIVLSLLILNWNGFMTLIGQGESYSTLYLTEMNESVVPQGNFGANIISLSDEDFQVFPKLAPVIRDKTQKPVAILDNGERDYTIYLTQEEYYRFIDHYLHYNYVGSNSFFEYKGKYYKYGPPAYS